MNEGADMARRHHQVKHSAAFRPSPRCVPMARWAGRRTSGRPPRTTSGYKAGQWGSYTTCNLSVSYRAMDNLTLSLMVNNVFNKNPSSQRHSFGGNIDAPYNDYLYNPYGRAIYAQVQYDFGAK
jgi:outer membrane receptor protein involved in Fe transport